MSKHETPMIRAYWESIGGTLVEEYPIVRASSTCGPRRLDAVIFSNGEKRIARWTEVSLKGEDIIVVQAKAKRLGMHLMGQALFSYELAKRLEPKSIRSVILCAKDDSELRPLLIPFRVEVVVLPQFEIRKLRPIVQPPSTI